MSLRPTWRETWMRDQTLEGVSFQRTVLNSVTVTYISQMTGGVYHNLYVSDVSPFDHWFEPKDEKQGDSFSLTWLLCIISDEHPPYMWCEPFRRTGGAKWGKMKRFITRRTTNIHLQAPHKYPSSFCELNKTYSPTFFFSILMGHHKTSIILFLKFILSPAEMIWV